LLDLPAITFPDDLPISQRVDDIRHALLQHQVVIVAGETGSGKTTQLPKICLAAGFGVTKLIGHTQPRRIAARAVAGRLAQELKTTAQQVVSYKIRFADKTSEQTRIKLMTDGILLAEIQTDRLLQKYDVLIIDEAHERSLNIDFLLGYIKWLLPKRPDLKIIITSATIDAQRFAQHFNQAPLIEVSGRGYPIEVFYRPLSDENNEAGKSRLAAILASVDEACRMTLGDILIFMVGERDIRDTEQALLQHGLMHTEIVPLFSRLSVQEQNKVFTVHTGRRIVLATNVAETSLTVPNIHVVIDPGDARLSRYNYRNKVQHLLIEPISQASANQRKGRCGRIAPGTCIRLYSAEDFLSRPAFTEPEILRTNLAAVILRMIDFKLGDILHFPFLEPPDKRWVHDGYKLLAELEAIDRQYRLTTIGKQLARWPIDPRFGRILLAASSLGCVQEVLIIVSALSTQDARLRDRENREKVDAIQHRWRDEHSDFLMYVNIWRDYHEQQQQLSRNKLEKYCEANFLSPKRMREWVEVYQQLHTILTEQGIKFNQEAADYNNIHSALLTGLLSFVANKYEKSEYLAVHQLKIRISPASSCFKKSPAWLMAASIINTGVLYAHCAAKIEPEWVEQAAKHLVKYNYSEPHWEKRNGFVTAFESATLYGLVVYTKRRVNYGPIDPVLSREIFIRHALVQGELATAAVFFAHNQKLIDEVETLEHKIRRRDLLVDEHWRYEFYDKRVPQGIYSKPLFEQWYKEQSINNPSLLFFQPEDLLQQTVEEEHVQAFPDTLLLSEQSLALSYQFYPGRPTDGVSIKIPHLLLNQIPRYRWQWVVPGLLEEKIAALLKSLPKTWRRELMPLADLATLCYERLVNNQQDIPLTDALTAALWELKKIKIPTNAWDESRIPAHLQINFKIVDSQNKLLAEGKDLALLQAQPQHADIPAVLPSYERTGITEWDMDNIPTEIDLPVGNLMIKRYLGLYDEGQSVSLRSYEKAVLAAHYHYQGVRRLLVLSLSKELKYLLKQVSDWPTLGLQFRTVATLDTLKDDLLLTAIDHGFLHDKPSPYTRAAFKACLESGKPQLVTAFTQLLVITRRMLSDFHFVVQHLRKVDKKVVDDIHHQLSQLIYSGFLTRTPIDWIKRLPVYLQAIRIRLDKPMKGIEHIAVLNTHWQRYQPLAAEYAQQGVPLPEPLITYRWMLEEYRVSLFAQQLKTAMPVSSTRLDKFWQEIKNS